MDSKTIEQKYQSMTQEQHILLRPDTYIGDIGMLTDIMYVYDDETESIIKKQISYVPGLYKIFDEILVNARDQTEVDSTCNIIKININTETNEITVYNNGKGIDIEIHNEHNIYVPELIFSKLLTSTNYDDSEMRTTGGRNGYGAKLANLFSTSFTIETIDITRQKKYVQTFKDNMSYKTEPIIKDLKKCKLGYTKITFIPDFSKFKLTTLTNDIISLFKKRAYDLAGVTTKCKVYYNDQKILCNNFENYIKLYNFNCEEYKLFFEKLNESWEIGLIYAPNIGVMEQISFINGICTYNGGTHISHIIDSIITIIRITLQKKHKDIVIKPHQVKENIILFVKGIVDKPSFTSQTKETLKTKYNEFGSTCEITVNNISKFIKSGILNQIMTTVKIKEQITLKKTDGKKSLLLKGIPKLEDANKSGGKDSYMCKLILTEGDSAKALAMSGRSIVGTDYYGIFPLKGKLLNVREATSKQLLENEEINNIKKIMGLQHDKEYNDITNLRYGGIILMTDQDSVTGDTPITIKIDNKIKIVTIEKLYHTRNLNEVLVWTNKGWTVINRIMRHYVNKQIVRVITPLASVDVTTDHSLISESEEIISPSQLSVGFNLLHKSYKYIFTINKNISNSKAFILGKRCANSLLKRKKAMIPSNIINGTNEIKYNFIKGLWNITKIITSNNKLTIHKLYFIFSNLKYNVYITYTDNYYNLYVSTEKLFNENSVIKIINLAHTKKYVYDLETTNHYFQAGIGCMIVHNTDGYHIKGLLLNFIHYFWPSLLKIPNFITSLTTPIVKAVKGNNILTFYNIPEYQHWKQSSDIKGYNIKYYKGLGTSNSKEAKEYFTNINEKLINYIDNTDDNTNNINTNSILLAFEKKHANDRKLWLQQYNKEIVLDNNLKQVSITDFINKELIHFSNEDISRSIPSICDGLKPSQRKILYGSILKKINNKNHEIKVAQLAGFIAEKTCYHHGEVSLTATIINMAQNHVGSNNINLLHPSGQFGTRISGKDAASPRYIYTYIEDLTRLIFRPEDDDILTYLNDDGIEIEPEFFVPIIPMILVNGTEGIGTGFSTKILCFNPKDIISNLLEIIRNETQNSIPPLCVWYKNFTGIIEYHDDAYYIYGKYIIINETTVQIIELPIGVWTTDYRTTLNTLESKNIIKKYISNCTEELINILIEIDEQLLNEWIKNDTVYSKLHLVVKKSMNNMHLYDASNKIKKYESTSIILQEFYHIRLLFYTKRKLYLIDKLTKEYELLKIKMKFINDILDKNIIIERKSKQEIILNLEKLNYPLYSESYEYLIHMPIYSLSSEKLNDLSHKCTLKEEELAKIKITTEHEMWINELNELSHHYDIWLNNNKINYNDNLSTTKKKKNKKQT